MTSNVVGSINPALIKAFVKSTKNVFSTMAGVDIELGKPTVKNDPTPSYDVSGIIGFSGDIAGSVVVSFCTETAVTLVEAFCGDKLSADSDDFADAIGELCNMIAGNAKKEFGLTANISIPTVIIGHNHTVARLRDVPCITIPCSCSAGNFAVEINIKQLVCVGV
jgi:chemotaxis protein CheX